MASRKSLMHPRVEELGGLSPTSSSPLRRRSSIAHNNIASSLVIENDDEAERRVRRHENSTHQQQQQQQQQGGQPNDSRRSLGLSFIAKMSSPQIAEKVQQCIQLSAENKINMKNAFTLQMIDFMTYMVKKKDANMNNLQVASTSLDVSAKIYGLRVDSIHKDILRMSGSLESQDKNSGNANNETIDDNGNAPGDNDAESQARERTKKARRCKKKIIVSAESLSGPTETVNLTSAMMGAGDTQTTDKLYLATIPYQANRGAYLDLYNDVVLDTMNPKEQTNDSSVACPKVNNLEKFETCSSLANFEILGWSADDETEEPQETPYESTSDQNAFHFDLDASLPADDGPSTAGMNFFDVETDENVEACERIAQPAVNIVDFRQVLEKPTHNQNSEYTYFESNMHIEWAGPSHWKIRHPSKNLAGSRIVGRCDQEPIKRKKELNLAYNDEVVTVARDKFELTTGNVVKLQTRTAKTGWQEEKITLPQDMHYDVAEICKFYLTHKILDKFLRNNDMNATHLSDDVGDYDYNNEHDTTDYCPNIQSEDQEDAAGAPTNNGDDVEENIGVCTQAFTGDNLVELPKMTNEIILAFSKRSKKIDMGQLKRCMWRNLTSVVDKETAHTVESTDTESREKMKSTVALSSVVKELPKTLSKNNAEALTLPVAFLSLLHLANEKTLKIDSLDDRSDLHIQQG